MPGTLCAQEQRWVTSSLPKRVPGVTVEIAVQRPTFSVDIRVKACDEQGK
jgi:hypothetical protein